MTAYNFLRDSQRRRAKFPRDSAGYEIHEPGTCGWPTRYRRRCRNPAGECRSHKGPAPRAEDLL